MGILGFLRGMGKLADNVKWKHFNPVRLNSILLSTGELFFSIKKMSDVICMRTSLKDCH